MACAIIHLHLPRRAETLGPFHQNAGMHLLEHVRRPPSPSRPGRLAAVSSSTWPCRSRSRLTCAPLFCVLVIRGDLFARRSATRLFRFTHVLGPPHLGRPLPSTSRSDASPSLAALPRRPPPLAAIASIECQAKGPSTIGTLPFPTALRKVRMNNLDRELCAILR